MSKADDRLRALFAQDEPPTRDPVFATGVMERMMRRRFQEEVLVLSGATAVGGVSLWALWPLLHPVLIALSQGFAPVLGATALAVSALMILNGRPGAALGMVT